MSEHHPSCKPSDRDLVWLCAQCGGHESAESLLIRGEQLAETLRFYGERNNYYEWAHDRGELAKSALAAWEKETK